jgi:hypothetical protein
MEVDMAHELVHLDIFDDPTFSNRLETVEKCKN